MFVDLVASLRFFNHAVTTVWQRWFSFDLSKNLQASYVTKQMLDRLVNAVFADVPAARVAIDARLKELRAHARTAEVTRDKLVEFLDTRGLSGAVIRDGQVHRDPAARLRDVQIQHDRRTEEAARHREARAIRRSVEHETRRLKVSAEECARLLEQSGATEPAARRAAAAW
jgi:hypothetical protein